MARVLRYRKAMAPAKTRMPSGTAQANSLIRASGESLLVAPTIAAKATPNRLSPTISPVAISTPMRSANSGFAARAAHLL